MTPFERLLYYNSFRNEIIFLRELENFFGKNRVMSTLYTEEHITTFLSFLNASCDYLSRSMIALNYNAPSNCSIGEFAKSIYENDKPFFSKLCICIASSMAKTKRYVPEFLRHLSNNSENDFCIGEVLFIIHFPKIELVQNENPSIKQNVYDVFACIGSSAGCIADPQHCYIHNQIGLSLFRTTYTYKQFYSDSGVWTHSHAVGDDREEFNCYPHKFCVGDFHEPTATPICRCVREIRSYMGNHITIRRDLCIRFIEHLCTVLRIESLSGHPHYSIGHISNRGSNVLSYSIQNSYSKYRPFHDNQSYRILKKVKKLKLLKFRYDSLRRELCYANSDIDVMTVLSSLMNDMFNTQLHNVVYKNGNIYEQSSISRNATLESLLKERIHFVFNGEEFRFKLVDDDTNAVSLKLIEPRTLNNISNLLLREAIYYIFQKKKLK